MKIAVTSKENHLSSQVDPRFGRAAFIIIIDTENFEFKALDNSKNKDAFKGAGIKAATLISDHNAEVLLTGYCGPNAFTTLEAAEIKVINDVEGTIEEVVKSFNEGKYQFSEGPNKEGHW